MGQIPNMNTRLKGDRVTPEQVAGARQHLALRYERGDLSAEEVAELIRMLDLNPRVDDACA